MYSERPAALPDATVWTRSAPPGPGGTPLVLPDGCMDLLWSGGRLSIAGPDTHAFRPDDGAAPGHSRHTGVRFHPGTAPRLLGVPAHELRDHRVPLEELRPAAEVRRLTAAVAAAPDPGAALERVARAWAAAAPPADPLVAGVVRDLAAGLTVGAVADAAGLGARLLHRRSLTAFGYGPKTLARVLRLQRALALARGGLPTALAAARAGYADQPHLAREARDLTGCRFSVLVPGAHTPASGSGA
ncbi:helix-turn-helix domain-containing protein [Streptomyces sp. NPDC050560]|uniref:helix-turn-helix domain-containing protein n=1 Tax=Streptomyces sp. NPDC050560 TaxID=3365630 RepID=UPI00379E9D14